MALSFGQFDKARVTGDALGNSTLPLARPVIGADGKVVSELVFRPAVAADLDIWDRIRETQAGMRALYAQLTGQPQAVIDKLALCDVSQCAGLVTSFFELPPVITA